MTRTSTLASLQIPFDLGHRTALGRGDFIIAPSNQDAVAWIDLWPDWPAPLMILYGPPACGKSHLAAVWGERAGAACVSPRALSAASAGEIADATRHVILEDADELIGNEEAERGLFHLYNQFKEGGRSILMTLSEPPVRRDFAIADVASRLRAAPAVAIREPDDVLLGAVLAKLFSDRQIRVGEDVIRYILSHMERSFEAARQIVADADRMAMTQKQPVTVGLVRGVVEISRTG